MNSDDNRYQKYSDENNASYYCPANAVDADHIRAESIPDDCIEADVVGRYAGNIEMA